MFQLLRVQPDLPGKKQNGMACGNLPTIAPLPRAWLCPGGPVTTPFLPRLPYPGRGSRSKRLELFCVNWHFFFSWRLHIPRFMLPEGFVSWGLFSVGRSSSDTVPSWKVGTQSLDVTGFVHIWKQSCNWHVADGFFEKHFFYRWRTNRT